MKFSESNELIFKGENNSKFIILEDFKESDLDYDIFIEFVTPSGKFYISDRLQIEEDLTVKIPLTSTLTAEYGWLVCQIVITKNGNEYIERLPIKKYFIHQSTEGEPGQEVENGLIYKMAGTKADDLIFEDEKLSLVANGKKIGKEIDLSPLSKSEKIQFASRLNFPNVGKPNIIYVDMQNHDLYVWNAEKLTYDCVVRDYSKLETINGGNA